MQTYVLVCKAPLDQYRVCLFSPTDSLCVVMEYASAGTLKDFLRSHPDLNNTEVLVTFALHVSSGMEYLASQQVVY